MPAKNTAPPPARRRRWVFVATAVAAYQKAVDVNASSNGYTMVGAVLVEQGKLGEAQEAIELEPEHRGAWVVRGDLMARVGRLDDAVRAYEETARVDPYRFADMARDRVTTIQSSRSGAP